MPRSVEEILAHADSHARRFEEEDFSSKPQYDPVLLRALHEAVIARAQAERQIAESLREAREAGMSWSTLGDVLGTSGEAARQRYRRLTETSP